MHGALQGKRVLIVEDEPLVGMLLQDMVEEDGATVVLLAQTLDEAVAAARSCHADVAILDINLRGRMSYPAAIELTQRGIPVLFVTGYAREGIPADLARAPVLPKPYTSEQIVASITRLLSAGPTGGAVAGHA